MWAHWGRKRATLNDELRRARWKFGFGGTAIGPESSCQDATQDSMDNMQRHFMQNCALNGHVRCLLSLSE